MHTRTLRHLVTAVVMAAAVLPLMAVTAQAAPDPGVCVPSHCVPIDPIRPPGVAAPSPSPLAPPGSSGSPAPATPDDNLRAIAGWVFGGANWATCVLGGQLGLAMEASVCIAQDVIDITR